MNLNPGIIQFDSQFAFAIPADKREDYFRIVDAVSGYIRKYSGRYDEAIDTSNDPIVIFNVEFIQQHVWQFIITELAAIGAVDITETLTFSN